MTEKQRRFASAIPTRRFGTHGPQPFDIAPTWRRVGAAFLDWALVVLLCVVLLVVLPNTMISLGWRSRFVGLALGTLYFGLANSRLTGGQTLGKRLLGIRTVGPDDKPLSGGRALLRGAVISLMITGGGLFTGTPLLERAFSHIALVLVMFTAYTLVVNVETKQPLHDLAVESYVVLTSTGIPRYPQPNQPVHLITPLIMGIAAVGAAIALAQSPVNPALAERIIALEGVDSVGFSESRRGAAANMSVTATPQGSTARVLTVNINANQNCSVPERPCEATIRAVMRLAQENLTIRDQFDVIDVMISNTVEFGWIQIPLYSQTYTRTLR